jgi:sugar fermentation stimulation protein A
MRLAGDLHEAQFIRRLSRFAGEVAVGRRRVLAHIPNSGRLEELLVFGRRVLLRRQEARERKTAYDLLAVARGKGWVWIDARLPPRLVEEALKGGRVPGFKGYRVERREVRLADGRIDLLLDGPGGTCYVETKAVTLVLRGTAIFPDAPTDRGRRHLLALLEAHRRGMRAAVMFLVQRDDARRFAPNWRTDPRFARTLAHAAEAGVPVFAYACRVTRTSIRIAHPLPVLLPRIGVTNWGIGVRH